MKHNTKSENARLSMGNAIVLATIVGIFMIATASSAYARSECRHACNEVRHQCKRVAKAIRHAEREQCDVDRAACRSECEFDSDPSDCRKDCRGERWQCRHDSNDLEKITKKACKGSRDDCRTTCETSVDPACSEECGVPMDDCLQVNEDAHSDCRAACPSDDTQRQCRDQCDDGRLAADSVCTTVFTACLAVCTGA